MSKMTYQPSMRDSSETEQINPMDEWARSDQRKGWVSGTNPKHLEQIDMITKAVLSGQISPEGVANLSKRVKGLAPYINSALASRSSDQARQGEVKGIVGKYINEGSPEKPAVPFETTEEQEFGRPSLRGNLSQEAAPAIPAKRDYQGAVDALASNPAYLPYAKEYQELGGLNRGTGRGEYYVPIQTAGGVKAFNARTGKIEDASKLPVVGSASDPELQGKLSGAKEYGQGVGKESVDIDRIMDAQTSLKDAKDIFQKGIYTGSLANIRKDASKLLPGADKTKAANTEEFISHIGNVVIPRLKEFGGNDTVEEMKYLQQVAAGNITLEGRAISAILNRAESKMAARQKRLSVKAGTVGLGGKVNAATAVETEKKDAKKGLLTDEQREALKKRNGL